MSRIGKAPIQLPKGVQATIQPGLVKIKGPKGNLETAHDDRFTVKQDGETLTIERPSEIKADRALHGLYRALIQNMVTGVTDGFSKVLELKGVGYRGKVAGRVLELSLGYSHPVNMDIPEGIDINVNDKESTITVSGTDKHLVGQIAANIRAYRPVEPYKGKGIRYQGERVIMKAGKAAK